MRMSRFVVHVGLMLAALSLSGAAGGCIAVGGARRVYSPTLGKQLQDLKIARDSNAITDAEYQDAKARMLNRDEKM